METTGQNYLSGMGYLVFLPKLPNLGWNDLPHNSPMAKSAGVMPLSHHVSVVLPQELGIVIVPEQISLLNLVLGLEEYLASATPEEVLRDRFAECQLLLRLLAEDDHVGEVGAVLLLGRLLDGALAEEPTGWEDGCDRVDDDLGSRELEVSSVVLKSEG